MKKWEMEAMELFSLAQKENDGGTYGESTIVATSKTKTTVVPQTIARVPGGDDALCSLAEAAIAGYGSDKANNLSSRFDVAVLSPKAY
jgi:hypothetical protein